MLVGGAVFCRMREIRESVTGSGCDSVCLTVVNAVARAVGTDPSRLEPLAGVVDPDALERLVADAESGGAIGFSMAGCEVEVDSGGDVTVTCPDAVVASGADADAALDADERTGADPTPGTARTADGILRMGGRGLGAVPDARGDERSRYEFTEFTDELGTVAVMYDTGNPDAWIQSTSPAAVER